MIALSSAYDRSTVWSRTVRVLTIESMRVSIAVVLLIGSAVKHDVATPNVGQYSQGMPSLWEQFFLKAADCFAKVC